MLVIVDAELARETHALFLHGGGAGHGEAETPDGAHGEPAIFVIAQDAIGMALQIGER